MLQVLKVIQVPLVEFNIPNGAKVGVFKEIS
jgi:hypothetical protein